MADRLLFCYDPERPDQASWTLVNSTGVPVSMIQSGAPEDAAELLRAHRTLVILDSKALHLGSVRLPLRNRQKLLRALPYAMEEHIADDVDSLHFVAGQTRDDGLTPVAAIPHDRLRNTLQRLTDIGCTPAAIIPDSLCLPADRQQWCLLFDADQVCLAYGSGSGLKIERGDLLPILNSLLDTADPAPGRLLCFAREDDALAEIEGLEIPAEMLRVKYNHHPVVIHAGHTQQAMPLNLLQDAYRPQNHGIVDWRRWRLPAALAACWLLLLMGNAAIEYRGLHESNAQLQLAIDQVYRNSFPESRKIVNARVQMEQKLDQLRTAGSNQEHGMLGLLSASASALAADRTLNLNTLSYRNRNVELELSGKSLESIERLNRELNRARIKAVLLSSSAEKDSVRGSIRIQGGDS